MEMSRAKRCPKEMAEEPTQDSGVPGICDGEEFQQAPHRSKDGDSFRKQVHFPGRTRAISRARGPSWGWAQCF